LNYHWQNYQVAWNPHMVERAHEETFKIYENLLTELAAELNEYHSISWTTEQYRKLIGNWLLHFIHILHDRWLGIENRPIPENGILQSIPFTKLGLEKYHESDHLNLLLYDQIAQIRDGGKLQTGDFPPSISCHANFKFSTWSENRIQIYDAYFHIPGSRLYGYWEKFKLYWGCRSEASRLVLDNSKSTKVDLDIDWRSRRKSSRGSSYENAFSKLIQLHLPVEFLEGFSSLRECAKKYKYKALYTAIAMTSGSSTPINFIAAEWHGKTKLLTHQHGGGIGLEKVNISEAYSRSVSDSFYTWGWEEDKKTIPLSTAMRIQSIEVEARRGILLKVSAYPRYVYRIMYQHMSLQNIELFNQTIRFVDLIKHLDLDVSCCRWDYGWQLKRRFIERGVPVLDRCRHDATYALHTANYLQTSWLETMAADIPTICFFDPNVSVFREKAQQHIDALEGVGILHRSPESAAAKVMEVCIDPQHWWQKDEVRVARKAFVGQYACLRDGWQEEWHREFERQIREIPDD